MTVKPKFSLRVLLFVATPLVAITSLLLNHLYQRPDVAFGSVGRYDCHAAVCDDVVLKAKNQLALHGFVQVESNNNQVTRLLKEFDDCECVIEIWTDNGQVTTNVHTTGVREKPTYQFHSSMHKIARSTVNNLVGESHDSLEGPDLLH